jgi:hypothetical protein
MSPDFKKGLATIASDAKAIAAVLTPVVVSGGTNVVVDLSALEPAVADIITLVKDVVAFLPVLESSLSKIKADIQYA